MSEPSPGQWALLAVLSLLWGFIGYRLSEQARRATGRTPWGMPSLLWAFLWFLSLLLGLVLYGIYRFTRTLGQRRAADGTAGAPSPVTGSPQTAMRGRSGGADPGSEFPAYPRPANSGPTGGGASPIPPPPPAAPIPPPPPAAPAPPIPPVPSPAGPGGASGTERDLSHPPSPPRSTVPADGSSQVTAAEGGHGDPGTTGGGGTGPGGNPPFSPPAWHPDPSGRFQYRWWNGSEWTSQVATAGQHLIDTSPDQRIGPY